MMVVVRTASLYAIAMAIITLFLTGRGVLINWHFTSPLSLCCMSMMRTVYINSAVSFDSIDEIRRRLAPIGWIDDSRTISNNAIACGVVVRDSLNSFSATVYIVQRPSDFDWPSYLSFSF